MLTIKFNGESFVFNDFREYIYCRALQEFHNLGIYSAVSAFREHFASLVKAIKRQDAAKIDKDIKKLLFSFHPDRVKKLDGFQLVANSLFEEEEIQNVLVKSDREAELATILSMKLTTLKDKNIAMYPKLYKAEFSFLESFSKPVAGEKEARAELLEKIEKARAEEARLQEEARLKEEAKKAAEEEVRLSKIKEKKAKAKKAAEEKARAEEEDFMKDFFEQVRTEDEWKARIINGQFEDFEQQSDNGFAKFAPTADKDILQNFAPLLVALLTIFLARFFVRRPQNRILDRDHIREIRGADEVARINEVNPEEREEEIAREVGRVAPVIANLHDLHRNQAQYDEYNALQMALEQSNKEAQIASDEEFAIQLHIRLNGA